MGSTVAGGAAAAVVRAKVWPEVMCRMSGQVTVAATGGARMPRAALPAGSARCERSWPTDDEESPVSPSTLHRPAAVAGVVTAALLLFNDGRRVGLVPE